MERIASFSINHNLLKPGLYTSRVDGDVVTYDLRAVVPNEGPYLDNDEMHTFEHLIATFLRNSAQKDAVVYFGPMGCRTGFYLLVRDTLSPVAVIALVQEALQFVSAFPGPVPGTSKIECGNAAEHSLPKAVALAQRMIPVLEHWTVDCLRYPE